MEIIFFQLMSLELMNCSIKPSKLGRIVLLFVHLVAAVCLYASCLPLLVKLLIATMTAGSLLYAFRKLKVGLQKNRSLVAIIYRREKWLLKLNRGHTLKVSLVNPTWACHFCLLMTFKESVSQQKHYVLLWPDQVTVQGFRQLQILLSYC